MKAALPACMRFGALREMHGLSAAGATLIAEVDETGATRIEALVVDPVAVKKVQHGIYNAEADAATLVQLGGQGLNNAIGTAAPEVETLIANLIQATGLVKIENGQTAAQALDALDVVGVGTVKTILQALVSTGVTSVLSKLAPVALAAI